MEPAPRIASSPRVRLTGVPVIGRSLEEYRRSFALEEGDLGAGEILDLGAGTSSFCAEAWSRGWRVLAVDPAYALPAEELGARSRRALAEIAAQLPGASERYNLEHYGGPGGVVEARERACLVFLRDFAAHRERYLAAGLPASGLPSGRFRLALVSSLLFLYGEHLDYAFHKRAVRELARLADEVRIFPLIDFSGVPSPHLAALRADPDLAGLSLDEVPADFEFMKGATRYLRVGRK